MKQGHLLSALQPRDMRHIYYVSMRSHCLEPESPFRESVWADQQMKQLTVIHSEAMLVHIIFQLFGDLLLEGLEALRVNYDWPALASTATLSETKAELKQVAHTGNTQLMSYSAIYHYCVRCDLELQMKEIEGIFGIDGRVLRRYHPKTWRQLLHKFLLKENAARKVSTISSDLN